MRDTLKSSEDLGRDSSAAFVTTDPIAAYKHFLPRARAIAADEVKPCPVDLAPAQHTIEQGLVAIDPHLDALRAKLPRLSIATLFELRPLWLGLSFAAARVACTPEGVMEDDLEKLRFMRNITLRQLEIFASLDLVPAARVKAIRLGPTPIDTCREAIAIVALFSAYTTELSGKHPFTEAQLNHLWEQGHGLQGALRSLSGGVTTLWRDSATATRDRFWTLLTEVHDELREAGVALFGLKHLDDHVPPLARSGAGQSVLPPPPD